jgi:hypothetical protein
MESLDLSSFFITKAQASDFAARLALVLEKVYTTDFELEKTIGAQFSLPKKDQILKLFRENQISETSPTEIQGFLKKLQESVAALPVVTLTIPFEPNDETLKAFSDWFLFTLKKQVIFAIEIDETLLAGARITFNGKYKDYSLRTKFMTIMEPLMQAKTVIATPSETLATLDTQSTSTNAAVTQESAH